MRPDLLNPLFREVSTLKGIGPKLSKKIENCCGRLWIHLLWHLPIGLNYRPFLSMEKEVVLGRLGTFQIQVLEHIAPARKKLPYRIVCRWGEDVLELVFFNYHVDFLKKQLQIGKTYFVSGRLEKMGKILQMLHPDYVTSCRDQIPVYEPIYPLTLGLSNKSVQKAVAQILNETPDLPEWLDKAFMEKEGFSGWLDSLKKAHFPHSSEELNPFSLVRKRLAYDELLANQLALYLVRERTKEQNGIALSPTQNRRDELLKELPFELTKSQKRVVAEIENDLASSYKMVRLLQGDVGSGKTIVALLSLLWAIDSGTQGVLMAPTDILARQHLATIQRWTVPLGIRCALLSGREKGKKREQILEDLKNGEIDLLIGTHAVFVENVCFKKLGLAVIDEQHKFGVHQRLALTQKQQGVNLLVMTATPIPRTLALTTYGDMDISRLNEKPANRKPIETRVMPVSKVSELMDRLRNISKTTGDRTQAYWICPLVEESEKSDLMAVEKRYRELKEFLGDRVGLVHGKMKGAEKDAVMSRFVAGEIDVLVATTVIEVGVDVKTATIMVIEHAERFGLAGLHQLRGRIGRGGGQSTCILLYGEKLTSTARERLRVMRETEDGFLIAEEDLKLRGAGELLGARQSGMQEFQMADLSVHKDLLYTASQDAKSILILDPLLRTPRGRALRILLYLFQKDSVVNTLKAG